MKPIDSRIKYKTLETAKEKGVTVASKESGIPYQTIYSWCKQEGIKTNNKARVTSNPFNTEKEESLYYLGLLATDGNVSSSNNQISISLIDKEPIEAMSKYIDINYYVYEVDGTTRYVINFANEETKEFLMSCGITPNKSKSLELNIPFSPGLLRGIIDGDGSYSYKEYNGKISRCITIKSSSNLFRQQIVSYLSEVGIQSTDRQDVVYIRVKSARRLYDLLYPTTEVIHIPRKRRTFELIINHTDRRGTYTVRDSSGRYSKK